MSLAEETERIIFTDHALEQMDDRDIAEIDVLRVLRNGRIDTKIRAGEKEGEWIVKMIDRVKGAREVGVVTAVVMKEHLVIVTAEWEDIR
jgi:hypothetical protein